MPKSRREVLLTVAAVAFASPALAACDLLGKPDGPPPPDPLTDFYASTLALVALYETAAVANPQLAPIRDAHKAHAEAIRSIMKPAPSSATPAPTPTAAPDWRAAEQQGYETATQVCLTAPAARATLLGEIAAARACHLEVLP